MWYYAVDSEQKGPVTLEELSSKIRSGELTGDTLVWTNNMRNWEPASTVPDLKDTFGELKAMEPQTTTPPAPDVAPLQPGSQYAPVNLGDDHETISLRPISAVQNNVQPDGTSQQNVAAPSPEQAVANMLICARCGKPVLPADALNYQGTIVCQDCKQQFLSDLYSSHGTDHVDYPVATFWQRLGAHLLDSIILWIVKAIIGGIIGVIIGGVLAVFGAKGDVVVAIIQIIGYGIGLIAFVLYDALFVAFTSATPGKIVLGLKVLKDGNKLTVGEAFLRTFGKILSGIICSIGYIMAAFNDETKALHDTICGTIVVSTK